MWCLSNLCNRSLIETPIEKIISIKQETGPLVTSISILDGASCLEIENVPNHLVCQFVTILNAARDALKIPKKILI